MHPLKAVLDQWQRQYWLNLVAPDRSLFDWDTKLALYSGHHAVEFKGPEVTTPASASGAETTVKSKSIVDGAEPVARVIGDYDYVVTRDATVLISLSDHARALGLTPVIWAGHVPGHAEIRFSVEA